MQPSKPSVPQRHVSLRPVVGIAAIKRVRCGIQTLAVVAHEFRYGRSLLIIITLLNTGLNYLNAETALR